MSHSNCSESEAQALVYAVLAEDFCVPADDIAWDRSIVFDLGIDGTDGAELIELIAMRSGADFSEFGSDGKIYFGPEGMPASQTSIVLISMVTALLGAIFIDEVIDLVPVGRLLLFASLFIASVSILGKFWPDRPLDPLTVADLIEAVRMGRWNDTK